MTQPPRTPDGVEMLITLLSELDGEADWQRPSGAIVPWFMCTDAASGVSDKITDRGIYSVHTFHPDYWTCKRYAFEADDLIMSSAPPLAPQRRITLADGRVAFADTVRHSLRPHREEYSDDLERFIARYVIELRIV